MRILLLSAYDAQSHKYWREGLVAQFPGHDWTQLVLPGRHFSWRIRGNSMQWALGERPTLDQHYDLIVATSMVDLSALKGMVPNLATIPSILYFHENQFEYPPSRANQKNHLGPKIVTLYGAIAADKLIFNSHYNQQSFITGVTQMLSQLPDRMPVNVAQLLEEKSIILPVPLNSLKALKPPKAFESLWPKRAGDHTPLRLVWAARWEYDKGPKQLQNLLRQLVTRGVKFELCILGQQFRQQPVEFEQIATEFSSHIVQFGYAESRHHYLSWLAGADMVLSTALHEFQGLSVLEAVQLGCIPILPNRLVYPELFGLDYLYTSNVEEPLKESVAAACLIQKLGRAMQQGNQVASSVGHLTWPVMKPKYESLFSSVC
ncbi:MAG TPA: DUF3524 domain-containing protein [Oceanospirillaceae bacterium]|nr:DUF3524 domain-containing protein [Oceanospirillaceae bacterium]